jgi:hypothetical protein
MENLDFIYNLTYDQFNETNNYSIYIEKIINEVKQIKANDWMYSRFILSCISFVVIIIGLITNFISSLAFSNKKHLSSTNIYLTSLCLIDCIALIGLLFNSIIYGIFVHFKYYNGTKLIMFIYPYVYPIVLTCQFANIYLTMSVSFNQFIIVAFSKVINSKNNKALKQKDFNKAYIIVLEIIIISILFCLPYWFTFSFNEINGLQRTHESKLYKKIVHLFLYIPFAYVIPFIVLITTNTYLLIKLIKTNYTKHNLKSRTFSTHTSNLSSLNATTKINKKVKNFEIKNKSTMLVAIVFFFLICQFPTLILHLIETESFGQNYKEHLFYFHLVELSKLLLIINLSFNFAFFYLFSQKFRSNLRDILCLKKNNSNNFIIV